MFHYCYISKIHVLVSKIEIRSKEYLDAQVDVFVPCPIKVTLSVLSALRRIYLIIFELRTFLNIFQSASIITFPVLSRQLKSKYVSFVLIIKQS